MDLVGSVVDAGGSFLAVEEAENGVVHVIDAVLLPNLEEPLPATVVDIIVNSAVHTTLEAAVIAAELADDLSGTGPFTVFAPTDAAFAALPAGTVDALLADPTGALADATANLPRPTAAKPTPIITVQPTPTLSRHYQPWHGSGLLGNNNRKTQ